MNLLKATGLNVALSVSADSNNFGCMLWKSPNKQNPTLNDASY